MNEFYEYIPNKVDGRCEMCRHHKFIILSSEGDELIVLHTKAHKLQGKGFPFFSRADGIHWWGRAFAPAVAPNCLKYYKRIGEVNK